MKLPGGQSAKGYAMLLGVGVVGIVVVTMFFRKQAEDALKAAGGAVSGAFTGNNALTQGTPYEGAGVLGTLGGAVNTTLGGVPEKVGSWLGGAIYDVLHWGSAGGDPNSQSFTPYGGARVRAEDKPTIWE